MKYWLLTTEYPPLYGGGISTYCGFTVKMMSEQGHFVTVFVNDATVKKIKITNEKNTRIIRFNPGFTNANSYLGHVTNISYSFAHAVKHFIDREGRPDIIEAQEYLGIAYYLLNYKYLLYDWCLNIPVLITAHSPAFLYLYYNHIPSYKYPEYWIGEMERFCLQAADHIISPSAYLIEKIKLHFSLKNNNIDVIPNPFTFIEKNIDTKKAAEGKIIFYGKLSAQKGTFKLLEYFKELWLSGFNEPLYLYGGQDIVYHPEGKTMGSIVKVKYKTFIDAGKLKLHSKISPSEIASHFSNSKLLIVPSTIDNLPYVLLEMMSLGNILLVSKQGGQAEVIQDGINGFVFDHEESGSFQKQLFRILNLGEIERTSIRKKAQETVMMNFNLQTVYAQKIKVVQQLISNRSQLNEFPFIRLLPEPVNHHKTTFKKGLLSIVVPYYNMGAYISETILSIEKNTYHPKEIIIINDGSYERESLEVLNRFRNVPDITVIDVPNSGLATARNKGAAFATGEYLAFLDADDLVHPNYYQKAIQVLSAYSHVHFIGSWTQYFGDSSKVWPTFNPEPPIILYHNIINSSALVYKRAAFLQDGRNDEHMPFHGLEDYDSVISLLASGFRGVILPEPLFKYRVRSDSMIRAISKNKKLFLAQHISKKYRAFYGIFAAEITSLLQVNGPSYEIDNPTLDFVTYLKNPFLNKFAVRAVAFIKNNPHLKKAALRIYKKLKS